MATFGLSVHCQLGGKILFDRICSVPVHSTLGQKYEDNIKNVEVAECVRLKKIKVGETKAGTATGSEIAETEVVATLTDLGLRFVYFICERESDAAADVEITGAKQSVNPCCPIVQWLCTRRKKKKKKSFPDRPTQF